MTHEQISMLVQIQSSLGELRNNASLAIAEANESLKRIESIVCRIDAEQKRISELLVAASMKH